MSDRTVVRMPDGTRVLCQCEAEAVLLAMSEGGETRRLGEPYSGKLEVWGRPFPALDQLARLVRVRGQGVQARDLLARDILDLRAEARLTDGQMAVALRLRGVRATSGDVGRWGKDVAFRRGGGQGQAARAKKLADVCVDVRDDLEDVPGASWVHRLAAAIDEYASGVNAETGREVDVEQLKEWLRLGKDVPAADGRVIVEELRGQGVVVLPLELTRALRDAGYVEVPGSRDLLERMRGVWRVTPMTHPSGTGRAWLLPGLRLS